MPAWHKMAGQWLPEFSEVARSAETPYTLWSELRDAFQRAYGPPRDEPLIERISGYASWCLSAPSGKSAEDDLATCVAVCFLEHIPEIKEARLDMPRWFTLPQILAMKSIFSYQIGEASFDELVEYAKRNRRLYRAGRR
jgi:hypothetical protein